MASVNKLKFNLAGKHVENPGSQLTEYPTKVVIAFWLKIFEVKI